MRSLGLSREEMKLRKRMQHAKVRRKPNVICDQCSTPMYRRPNRLKANAGKYCSTGCRNKAYPLKDGSNFPPPKFGSDNPAWKGGVIQRHRHGNYVQVRYVRAPEWARLMARKDGYVMEHRLVMANRIGRTLLRVEVVHHDDHAPLNNAPTNLELWPDNRSHKLWEHGQIAEGAACRLFHLG